MFHKTYPRRQTLPREKSPPAAGQSIICLNCAQSIERSARAHLIDPDIYACQTCLPDLILEQEQFDQMIPVARETLDTLLGLQLQAVRSIRLAARRSVNRPFARPGESPVSNFTGTASFRGRILVSRGYDYQTTIGILCHEMGHLWQFENGWEIWSVHPLVKEGFCEWVAVKALQSMNYYSAANRLLWNSDPVYGVGLQYFMELEKKATVAQIMSGYVVHPALLDRFKYASRLRQMEKQREDSQNRLRVPQDTHRLHK